MLNIIKKVLLWKKCKICFSDIQMVTHFELWFKNYYLGEKSHVFLYKNVSH